MKRSRTTPHALQRAGELPRSAAGAPQRSLRGPAHVRVGEDDHRVGAARAGALLEDAARSARARSCPPGPAPRGVRRGRARRTAVFPQRRRRRPARGQPRCPPAARRPRLRAARRSGASRAPRMPTTPTGAVSALARAVSGCRARGSEKRCAPVSRREFSGEPAQGVDRCEQLGRRSPRGGPLRLARDLEADGVETRRSPPAPRARGVARAIRHARTHPTVGRTTPACPRAGVALTCALAAARARAPAPRRSAPSAPSGA